MPRVRVPNSRRFFLPFLFTGVCWALLVLHQVGVVSPASTLSADDALPPHPKTLSQSWDLARLELQLKVIDADETLSSEQRQELTDKILEEVAKLTQRKQVTKQALQTMLKLVEDMEAEKSTFQKIVGIFSFVNIMWGFAILGITATVIPCMYVTLRPIERQLIEMFLNIYRNVIIPMHTLGIFEFLFYLFCTYFLINGARSPSEKGMYISITGMALSLPSFFYANLFLYEKTNRDDEERATFVFFWLSSVWTPMAMYFRSSLIGWISIIFIYCFFGFLMAVYYIKKHGSTYDLNPVLVVVVCSVALLSIFSVFRILGISRILDPFGTPVMTFGSVAVFAALLVYSSYRYYYHQKYEFETFQFRQIPIIALTIFEIFIGTFFGIDCLTNSGFAFLAFYLYQKWWELHQKRGWDKAIFVFPSCLVLWRISLYLHVHPDFVVSLFTPWF